jgi:transposase
MWRYPTVMRALEPEVFDTVWAAIEALLPVHAEIHPLGCPRVSDRDASR